MENCEVIRYVVRMRNGGYLKQLAVNENLVKASAVDLPIDSDLLKDKEIAKRVIEDILTRNTYIPVKYNENNPPVEVEEFVVKAEIIKNHRTLRKEYF